MSLSLRSSLLGRAGIGRALRTTTTNLPLRAAFSASARKDVKVLAVLYTGGTHAKEEPRLLGTVENQLGLREYLESKGHELVVTDDKEGAKSEFMKHIKDAEILVTTPFHPAYATKEVLDQAKNLKLAVTAGVGSDHVDLDAANEHKVTVAEVTGSNVVSVAEHVVMDILVLVRNYEEGHKQALNGEWEVSKIARNAFDLENKVIGTVGSGRIGYRVLQRLKPFNPKEMLYFDYKPLPDSVEKELGVRRVEKLDDLLAVCDVVTINTPLHEGTRGLFNKDTISKMKKGSYLINTARGAICVAEDVADALKRGHLNGYAGDVWPRQPAPADHPWRTMRNPMGQGNGMTPHYSGTTLDAQKRYAEGAKDIIARYLDGKEQEKENVIVTEGKYASEAYGQR